MVYPLVGVLMKNLRMCLVLLAILAIGSGVSFADGSDPSGAVGINFGATEECDRISVCSSSDIANGEAWTPEGLLWQTDFSQGLLKLIDIDNDCTVVQTCPAPGGASPSENAFNGDYLYHYDFGTGMMYEIDPATCEVVSSANPPGDDSAEGLTYDFATGLFWKGDSTMLYGFTYTNGTVNVVTTCPNPAGDSADGLAICGNYLLMLGYTGTLYQIDLDTCEEVSSCQLNAGAAGNGIASNLVSQLWVDQPGFIDILDRDCDQPVPTRDTSWGGLKSLFR